MMQAWRRISGLLLLALGVAGFSAQAQPVIETGTLDKIRDLGVVYLGHRESSVPFSYLVDGKPTGYTVEICQRVVEEIRKRLEMPVLKVVPVALPSNLRFTMLIDGIVDMECGASINTKVRQQRMAFSVTFHEASTRFLVANDAKLEQIQDLDGKTVVVAAATTAGRAAATAAKRRNISLREVSARDRDAALELLAAGKADAFLVDDALLLGSLLGSPYYGKFRLMSDPVSAEPYGIAIRRDDPAFKALVDDVLIGMMKRGEMAKLYQKWFMAPIPPSGKSMDMPLDVRNLELFEKPNDKGV